MFEIGNNGKATVEYTVYKLSNGAGYLVECDGREVGTHPTVKDAHKAAQAHARTCSNKGAGLTEAFGRNRQFTFSPRYALQRYGGRP